MEMSLNDDELQKLLNLREKDNFIKEMKKYFLKKKK